MAVTTERAGRPAGLQAATVAEAFQATANAHPDRVALRTKGDVFSLTWREYAQRVEATAAGLAGLGLGRGDTMAIMLTNRPEFHWFDSAALHLGATPFSLYNTYTTEQIQFQVEDAGARILVTEKAFAERAAGRRASLTCSWSTTMTRLRSRTTPPATSTSLPPGAPSSRTTSSP
jgi:acyl-CoA synthetase (AMP-forming)/AMP-acid ligase II